MDNFNEFMRKSKTINSIEGEVNKNLEQDLNDSLLSSWTMVDKEEVLEEEKDIKEEKKKEGNFARSLSLDSISINGFGQRNLQLDDNIQEKKEANLENYIHVQAPVEVQRELPAVVKNIDNAAKFMSTEAGHKSELFSNAERKVHDFLEATKKVGNLLPPDGLVTEYYEARDAVSAYVNNYARKKRNAVGRTRSENMRGLLAQFETIDFEGKLSTEEYTSIVKPFVQTDAPSPAENDYNNFTEQLKKVKALDANGGFTTAMVSIDKFRRIVNEGSVDELMAVIAQSINYEKNQYTTTDTRTYVDTEKKKQYTELYNQAESKLLNNEAYCKEFAKKTFSCLATITPKVLERYNKILAEENLTGKELNKDEAILVKIKLAMTPEFRNYDVIMRSYEKVGTVIGAYSVDSFKLLKKEGVLASVDKLQTMLGNGDIFAALDKAKESKDERVKAAYSRYVDHQLSYADKKLATGYLKRADGEKEALAKNYDSEELAAEFLRSERRRTHNILNDTISGGDSKEMSLVKSALKNLEILLNSMDEVTVDKLDEVSIAYKIAIANSANYLNKKDNPSSEDGKRRYRRVHNRYLTLITEANRFEKGRKLIDKTPTLMNEVWSPLDVVKIGDREFRKKHSPMASINRKNVTAIQSLQLEDFMAMVGEMNRGEIVFKDGALKMINNSRMKTNEVVSMLSQVLFGGEPETVANVQIRERLLTLIKERYGDRLSDKDTTQIMKYLDLDKGKSIMGGISRSGLANTFRLLRDNCTYAKKNADDPIAKSVAEHIVIGRDKTESNYAIKKLLEKAKTFGIDITGINEHNLSNLRINMGFIQDEVCSQMLQINKYMSVLSNGKEVDLKSALGEHEKKVMEYVTALVMMYHLSATREVRAMRKNQLDSFVKTLARDALKLPKSLKREDVKTLGEAEELFENKLLSENGSRGLDLLVDKKMLKTSSWKNKKTDVLKGARLLGKLCDNLSEFDKLKELALTEGINKEEADRLQALGDELQQTLGNREELAGMELVAKELGDSRFKKGFDKVKELIGKRESSYSTYANIICRLTLNKNAHRDNNKAKKVLPSELENFVALSKSAQAIVRVFMLERDPSELVTASKNKKEYANNLVNVQNILRDFPMNSYVERIVAVGSEKIKFIQLPNNQLNVVIDNRPFTLTKNAHQIAEHIESNVMSNADLYGEERAKEIYSNLAFEDVADGVVMHSRSMCIKYLSGKTKFASKKKLNGKTKLPDTYFNNVPTSAINTMTKYLMDGTLKIDDVIDMVDEIETGVHFNTEESLELMEMVAKNKEEAAKKWDSKEDVIFTEQEVKEEPVIIELDKDHKIKLDEWSEEESKVKDFVADLIFSSETWAVDSGVSEDERIKNLIDKHIETVVVLLNNPKLLSEVIGKLPSEMEDAKKEIEESMKEFMEDEEVQKLKILNKIPLAGKWLQKQGIGIAINKDHVQARFKDLEKIIANNVNEASKQVQQILSDEIKNVFKTKSGKEDKTKVETVAQGNERLKKIIENSSKGGSGQGLFVKNILNTYFKDADFLDKRAMIASAIRYSKPMTKAPKGLDTKKDTQFKEMQQGRFFGGLIKGAGPLLQKLMQGLPTDDMPVTMVQALEDIKSKLSPIPKPIVEAQMHNIVSSSNGRITSIRVDRALGAASVAQTFLCTMFGPGFENGKEVAIKLLRPEVKNRMEREKKVMIKAARMADNKMRKDAKQPELKEKEIGGMQATYQGQLQRIEEEMDLRLEARNAQRAVVYDRGFSSVKSVKVDSSVEPTANTMVLEKADGDTVDNYMQSVDKEVISLINSFVVVNDGKVQYDRMEANKPRMYNINQGNIAQYAKACQRLPEILKQLQLRHAHMSNLADMWVREGVFGEGFYHGDMHAGNIMIDDKGVTVIDFGNATQLNEMQRGEVLRMMVAAACGDSKIFLGSFKKLLENTSEAEYSKKKKELKKIFDEVLKYGDGSSSGLRIAAALMRAQEIGIELPPAIYNFSQSQLRLQNAIDGMNESIITLQKLITNLDKVEISDAAVNDVYISKIVLTDGDSKEDKIDTAIKTFRIIEGEEETEARKKLNMTDDASIEAFESEYLFKGTVNAEEILKNFKDQLEENKKDESYNEETNKLKAERMTNTMKAYHDIMPFAQVTGTRISTIKNLTKSLLGFEKNQDLQKTLKLTLEGLDKSPLLDTSKKYKAFRDAQKDKDTTKEKLKELEDAFMESYKLSRQKAIETDRSFIDFARYFPQTKSSAGNKIIMDRVNKLRESWAGAKDICGEAICRELDDAINALVTYAGTRMDPEEARKKAKTDKKVQEQFKAEQEHYNELLEKVKLAYRRALVVRLKAEKEVKVDLNINTKKPDSFAEAMGDLVQQNVASSARKLGIIGVIRNRKILSEMFN